MRWTPTALLLALAAATAHRAEATPGAEAVRAREAAQRILRRLDLQLGPSAGEPSSGRSGGNPLSRYAALSSADPSRIESTVDYARRTLAGTATARLTPESTIHFLRERAEEILTGPGSIPTAGASTAVHAADLRVIAALARFHARRLEAAIHYNLFLRDSGSQNWSPPLTSRRTPSSSGATSCARSQRPRQPRPATRNAHCV